MKALKIAQILTRFLPAVRALVDATTKGSDGGRRITPTERDQILQLLLQTSIEVVEDELPAA